VQELLEGLTETEIAAIDEIAEVEFADAGGTIVREGDDGSTVFFLLSGRVSVQVQLDGGRTHRLSTLGPGVAFGELAMLDQSRRSADVVADEHSMLARVAVDDLQKLGDRFPEMTTKIYRNLARNLARRMLAANEQVRALDQ
jgi:CRP-like cAMP-binding protein